MSRLLWIIMIVLPAVIDSCILETEKPNIILILSDDQAWGDAESSGNNIIETPNLNRIAKEGTSFDRFFVSPMCAPTRASLMTGRYNLRCGTPWVGRRTEMLGLDETTMAEILKEEGYSTACYGKWHLGAYGPYHPNERGFENFTGFLGGAANNYFETRLEHNGNKFRSEGYITDVLTDSVLNYIEKHKDGPFFCYIPYNVPHHPFQVPDKYFKKYKEKGVEDNRTASVYGMVENMDENIGRILDQLENLGLDENTMIIFMSDNGPAFYRYNDDLKGKKAQVSEGSVKVPLYIKWKGRIPAGEQFTEVAAHIDILPTILDAATIEMPKELEPDGMSLWPYLSGSNSVYPDRRIYAHQTYFGECSLTPGTLRTGRYRLENWKDGYQLFDMHSDPSQKRDISAEKPELTKQLTKDYREWYGDVTSGGGTDRPPVPVGFPGYDTVDIIAPDALITDGIKYKEKWGWATDWFIEWTNTADSVTWPVDVMEKGVYSFSLRYWCEKENTGASFVLSTGKRSVSNKLTIPMQGPFHVLPDQVPEASPKEREWAELYLGEMELEEGKYELVLKATIIPGRHAGEIRALKIIRII